MRPFSVLGVDLTAAEVAFAAGLFEGEGWVGGDGRHGVLKIQMTDREPLDFMARCFGGYVAGPIIRRPHKDQWRWSVSNWEGIERLATLLTPWLSPRRCAQFAATLARKPKIYTGYRKPNRYPSGCPTVVVPTSAFYERHRRRGEPPCEVCLACLRALRRQQRRAA